MDDGISLNISFASDESSKVGQDKRTKVSRPDRLKQKRQERKDKEKTIWSQFQPKTAQVPLAAVAKEKQQSADTGSDTELSSTRKSNPAEKKRKRKQSSDGHRDDTRPRKQIKFSSLFTHNPEIPHVATCDVKQVKEAVFSDAAFSSLSLHPYMVSNLDKLGMSTMTTVQQLSIPAILKSQDVLIRSQTGSGKTLSYAVPIIERLQSLTPKVARVDGPYCVIIVPTRELAIQSHETLVKLLKPFVFIVPGCLMGGEKRKSEKARLRKGINVLVATPGRLVDHITKTKSLQLQRIKFLVIDEADRLLDMGFEKDVSTIITALKDATKQCQTILLSATLSAGVERLAGMSLRDPVRIDVSHQMSTSEKLSKAESSLVSADEFTVPENLTNYFVVVPMKLRLVTLAAFLLSKCKYTKKHAKVVVFLSTQDAVEFHYQLLGQCVRCGEGDDAKPALNLFKLYGNMQQNERRQAFHEFQKATSGVLLCTDVAARGLNLEDVDWIVQYNVSTTTKDYVHRVGRTARIGGRGNALLFLSPSETEYVNVLGRMKISLSELQMSDLLKTLLTSGHCKNLSYKGDIPRTADASAAFLQSRFERHLIETTDLLLLARKAFVSSVRAYATYPAELKHIFHPKKLHLGHVAKSFGLTETPNKIAELLGKHVAQGNWAKSQKLKGIGKSRSTRSHKRVDMMSEFASGLD